MTAATAMGAGNGSFLNRITTLEREVGFLKSKIEEDARWKGILEKWILDNFGISFIKSTLQQDAVLNIE
jgi:hypothetical protein